METSQHDPWKNVHHEYTIADLGRENERRTRSHSVTKQIAHWSLKTRSDKLPSNIAHKTKITSGPSFFLGANFGIIIDGVDVMAALKTFVMNIYENEVEQGLVEEEEIAEEKEKAAEEAGRRKRGRQ